VALDIAVLDENGVPEWSVAIVPEEHVHLMAAVRSLGLKLLSRLHDYYADAEFQPAELNALLRELERLCFSDLHPALLPRCRELVRLIESARDRGAGVVAIAD
jgi:hypothetical protein